MFTGLGSIGLQHVRLLGERDETIEFIAHRSGHGRSSETPSQVTEYAELDRALEAGPDVAFITNPTHLHVPAALRCAESGCDLFVEKPLSHSLSGLDELIRAADARRLITMVGCQLRFDPVLQRARELVRRREYGKVCSFRAYCGSYLPDWRTGRDHRDVYSARPEHGGGVVLDLIHEIDYLFWILGSPVSVTSALSTVESLEIESEAIAEILLEMEDGSIGSIHLDYCRRRPKRTFELVCEEACISGDLLRRNLIIEAPGDVETTSFGGHEDDRLRAQLDYFLRCLRHRESCDNDLREGRAVLEIALRAKNGQRQ